MSNMVLIVSSPKRLTITGGSGVREIKVSTTQWRVQKQSWREDANQDGTNINICIYNQPLRIRERSGAITSLCKQQHKFRIAHISMDKVYLSIERNRIAPSQAVSQRTLALTPWTLMHRLANAEAPSFFLHCHILHGGCMWACAAVPLITRQLISQLWYASKFQSISGERTWNPLRVDIPQQSSCGPSSIPHWRFLKLLEGNELWGMGMLIRQLISHCTLIWLSCWACSGLIHDYMRVMRAHYTQQHLRGFWKISISLIWDPVGWCKQCNRATVLMHMHGTVRYERAIAHCNNNIDARHVTVVISVWNC